MTDLNEGQEGAVGRKRSEMQVLKGERAWYGGERTRRPGSRSRETRGGKQGWGREVGGGSDQGGLRKPGENFPA